MSIAATLRTLVAVEGVLEEDDSSDLRFSELVLEGVEPLTLPLLWGWFGVTRSVCGFFTARVWLWMSLSVSFALRFSERSELPKGVLAGDGAAARALWTGCESSKSLALTGGEADSGEGFLGFVLTGIVGLKGRLAGRSLCESRPVILGFTRGVELLSIAGAFFVRILEASEEGVLLEGATARGVEFEGVEVAGVEAFVGSSFTLSTVGFSRARYLSFIVDLGLASPSFAALGLFSTVGLSTAFLAAGFFLVRSDILCIGVLALALALASGAFTVDRDKHMPWPRWSRGSRICQSLSSFANRWRSNDLIAPSIACCRSSELW